MRKGYKRRYIKLSKNEKQTRIIIIAFVFFSLFLTMGYSLYRETITKTLSMTINRPTFTITLDNQSATTAGTSSIYVKYATGYYLNSNLSNKMTTSANGITIPTKTGYIFKGYYDDKECRGVPLIDEKGKLSSTATTISYTKNTTVYAYWVRLMAENVSYDNTKTGLNCSNTQCAIDKLYEMLNN